MFFPINSPFHQFNLTFLWAKFTHYSLNFTSFSISQPKNFFFLQIFQFGANRNRSKSNWTNNSSWTISTNQRHLQWIEQLKITPRKFIWIFFIFALRWQGKIARSNPSIKNSSSRFWFSGSVGFFVRCSSIFTFLPCLLLFTR